MPGIRPLGSSTRDDFVVLGYLVDIMGLTLLFYWMCKKGDEAEKAGVTCKLGPPYGDF